MARPWVHLLTPGDHYSPRTGSAVPTVVDGLSKATPPGDPEPSVLLTRGTYPDRYPSAVAVEYDRVPPRRRDRYVDALLGRAGLPRIAARRQLRGAFAAQHEWAPSTVFAHNAVQALPLVDRRHLAVLYAHNELFRSYAWRESGRILDHGAGIVSVSRSLADQLAGNLPPRASERIRVVLNGVDSAAFGDSTPRRRGDVLRVMFVGRMIPKKGPDVLVDAVARLGRRDVHLTLVGGSGFDANDPLTPYEQRIRQQATRLAGGAEVRPFVPRSEVAATLSSADVVVVPSRWPDPCPLTVLEGMAAGAALVGARIGGIPEQLGSAGIAVGADDAGELAAVLEHLADDERALQDTRMACRAHAVANDWTVVRGRLQGVLDELD